MNQQTLNYGDISSGQTYLINNPELNNKHEKDEVYSTTNASDVSATEIKALNNHCPKVQLQKQNSINASVNVSEQ